MIRTEVNLPLNPVQLKTAFGKVKAGRNTGSFIKHLPESSSEQTAVFVLLSRGQGIKLANLCSIWSESLSGRGETECLTKNRSASKTGCNFNAF